ncbi:hypothetical protein [Candidatus Uabimicrobium amorphum]|uniref:Uncharacterized protein n=1 Tax=Uabimicrobium amorphum TaxID=2596890 RepID=A0A5S9IR16_UABAM|nr:hypothetical protein [Candidatus Uabimicrobium amorphum]BBM86324.1 hypothetical protein UABAM_04710 [Candidatus Uabimicrobium amorphum]
MKEKGILLGEMQAKLLQKIEELTLYTIEQEKKIQQMSKEKIKMENKLLRRIEKLESAVKNK